MKQEKWILRIQGANGSKDEEIMGEEMQLKWSTRLQLYNNNDEEDDEIFQKMDLPHDMIIYDIVTRLPIKSILKYKSVSKQWCNSLSSSNFGNSHFKLSPLYHPFSTVNSVLIHSGNNYFLYTFDEDERESDYVHYGCEKGLFKLDIDFDYSSNDEIFLIGSCNGLLCLYSLLGYLIIWNPVIHKWTKFSYPLMEGFQKFTWGFGYVTAIDDYKLVRISSSEESRLSLVHVFSLKTQKWKQIHDDSIHGMMPDNAAGVLINETLYWIVSKTRHGEKQGIIGYDLVHEKFNEIRGLNPGDSYLSSFRFLGCMGGYLAMGRYTSPGDVSISIRKQNGQAEYIGLYRDMNLRSCSAVFGFTKGGKFLVQLGDQELGLVDPTSSPKKYTRVVAFRPQRGNSTSRVLSYTPSLISPFAVSDMSKE